MSGAQTRILTRTSTASTDAIAQSDCGKLISYSSSNPTTVTIPTATSLPGGCWIDLQNAGTGTVTVSPAGSTVDGGSSLTLTPNQGVRIVDTATAYLTERGQGSSEGSVTYSADGTYLTLTGTTFSANTAALASRVTSAQATDTTCAITSGSLTAYVGSMRGNAYTTGYADGMRVLAEVDTTSGGGAITLDCGSGPKSVYQNDGATNPTTAQWAGGQQVFLAYDGALNSSAGGWRILSGEGGGGASVQATTWTPTGGMIANNMTAFSSPNQVRYLEIDVPYPGRVVTYASVLTDSSTGHAAAAFYDSTCTLIAQSNTLTMALDTPQSFTFSPVSLPPGKVFFAWSVDSSEALMVGGLIDTSAGSGYGFGIANVGEPAANYHLFSGSNMSSGTTTITMPGSCGTRTALSGGYGLYTVGVIFH